MKIILAFIAIAFLAGCASAPISVKPITGDPFSPSANMLPSGAVNAVYFW